jgi:hypothetical protein
MRTFNEKGREVNFLAPSIRIRPPIPYLFTVNILYKIPHNETDYLSSQGQERLPVGQCQSGRQAAIRISISDIMIMVISDMND